MSTDTETVPAWAPPGARVQSGSIRFSRDGMWHALCHTCGHLKEQHSVYRKACLQDPECVCTTDPGYGWRGK